MKSTDIKEVKYNGNEVIALYRGGNLIYRKIPTNVIAGTFKSPGTYSFKYNVNKSVPVTVTEDDLSFSVEVYDLTSCKEMFYSQQNLQSITMLPDTSNVTDMREMFRFCMGLISVDLSRLDTENVTTMADMFRGCTQLGTLDLSNFNTKNVTHMGGMFCGMPIRELDVSSFDTGKVENMNSMFSGCYLLRTLNIGNMDVSNVTDMGWWVAGTNYLSTIKGTITGIKCDVDFTGSPLSKASALIFLNGLEEVEETKTISFKTATYNTLTDEQLAIATARGWSVVAG